MVRVLRISGLAALAVVGVLVVLVLVLVGQILGHRPTSVLSRPLTAVVAPTPRAFYPDASAFCKAAALEPLAQVLEVPDAYGHGLLGVMATTAPTLELRAELVGLEQTLYVDHSTAGPAQIAQAAQGITTQCEGGK